MTFEERWANLFQKLLDNLDLPEDTPQPAPTDLAGAMEEHWLAPARDTFDARLARLTEARLGPRPASMPEYAIRVPPELCEETPDGELRTPVFDTHLGRLVFFSAADLARVAALWEAVAPADRSGFKHPLAALIEGWLTDRPEEIRPAVDKGGRPYTNGILPSGLLPSPPATVSGQLTLIPADELPALGRIEPDPATLPLLAEMMSEEDLPVTPLILANAAGFRGLQPGTGARYDKRIMIFSLLSMPLDQRRPGGRYEWRPKLRELRDLLFPARPRSGRRPGALTTSYRPKKHAWPLHSAMSAVNLAEIRLPDGCHWRPVIVRGYPDFHDLSSEVIVEIRLPDGSDRGPLVDRLTLAEAGAISDPAFDLELGLAYLWDEAKGRNGGYRIYATRPEVLRNAEGWIVDAAGQVVIERGRPSTRWDHPSAVRTGRQERHPQAHKVRVLTREDRRRLAYGPGTALPGMPVENNQSRDQLSRDRNKADARLAQLEAAGRIVIERGVVDDRTGKKGWRILEAWPLA